MSEGELDPHGRVVAPAQTEAVLFDMGGVLLRSSGRATRVRWENRLGLDPGGYDRLIAAAIGPGWEGGREPADVLRTLSDLTGLDQVEADQMLAAEHFDADLDPLLATFIRAHRHQARMAVVSNNGPGVRRHWNTVHQLDQLVDLVVISGEERIAKPDPRIYLHTAARLGVDPNACVLVDDSQRNVEGAQQAGMDGILHRTAGTTIQQLQRLVGSGPAM
jgi:putative hydrolase of the HAD superfamily